MKFPRKLYRETIWHILWVVLFAGPLAYYGLNVYTLGWACQWFWFRELWDQWHGRPLGREKIVDILEFEIGTAIVLAIYLYV